MESTQCEHCATQEYHTLISRPSQRCWRPQRDGGLCKTHGTYRAAAESLLPSGTRASIVVPPFGFDSMEKVPCTKRRRSRMLTNPNPL